MSRPELTRRTFVAATGTASMLALAGCTNGGTGNNSTNNSSTGGNNTTSGNSESGTATLTVTVEDNKGNPVEGATVTVEEAGTMNGGTSGDGSGNETSEGGLGTNESGGTSGDGSGNETSEGGLGTNESDGTGGGNETSEGNRTSGEAGRNTWSDETDQNGQVTFEELMDGTYTVTAENKGTKAEKDVEISGQDTDVTVTLGANGETGGRNETGDGNSSL